MGAQHVESDGESSITNPRQASGPARGVFAKTSVICATASAVAAWSPHFMAHPARRHPNPAGCRWARACRRVHLEPRPETYPGDGPACRSRRAERVPAHEPSPRGETPVFTPGADDANDVAGRPLTQASSI